MHKSRFNKGCELIAITVVFICASAFACDESVGLGHEDKVTKLEAYCYPLLAISDSARRAQQQAEQRRREYLHLEAEEAEERRTQQQAEQRRREYLRREAEEAEERRTQQQAEQRRREYLRREAEEIEKRRAKQQAEEKREGRIEYVPNEVRGLCNGSIVLPKIGMTLDQVQACFGSVRLVGHWSSSSDSTPTLIYRAGRYHLLVTNGRVVDWY